jgi:hypothetical protein
MFFATAADGPRRVTCSGPALASVAGSGFGFAAAGLAAGAAGAAAYASSGASAGAAGAYAAG